MGTPAYMAPEQAMNGEVDGRSDLYSLGIMLYEMLSGIKPFSGGVLSLIHHHLATPPPPLLERLPMGALPEAGQAVVMKLLAKNPQERYADAGALVSAIDATLGSHPELVVPQSALSAGIVSAAHAVVRAAHSPTPIPTPTPSSVLAGALVPRTDPKPTPVASLGLTRWVRMGAPVLILLLAVGTAAVMRSRSRPKNVALLKVPIRPVEVPPQSPLLAPDAQLAPALLAGASALELLSKQFPEDPRLLRGLARAYATQRDQAGAARTVGRLLALTPEAKSDPELGRMLTTAALGSAAALNAAVEVLEGPMGELGVDLLIDVHNRIQTKNGKAHLAASLAKPTVRAHASPATLLYLDLRAAGSCAARHALLARARQVGDHRALALLRPLEHRQGCGFLNLNDCWQCLRQDWGLRDAIAAIEARPARSAAPSAAH